MVECFPLGSIVLSFIALKVVYCSIYILTFVYIFICQANLILYVILYCYCI